MKNFILSIIFLSLSIVASAQHTDTRFGTPPTYDNTGRTLTYNIVTTADASGTDTINITPNAYLTYIVPSAAIKDTVKYNLKSLNGSFTGDQIIFSVTNSTGSNHKLYLIGTGWQVGSGTSTISLTSAKRATLHFVFDGAAWVEISRTVQ